MGSVECKRSIVVTACFVLYSQILLQNSHTVRQFFLKVLEMGGDSSFLSFGLILILWKSVVEPIAPPNKRKKFKKKEPIVPKSMVFNCSRQKCIRTFYNSNVALNIKSQRLKRLKVDRLLKYMEILKMPSKPIRNNKQIR